MMIIMHATSTKAERQAVLDSISRLGFKHHVLENEGSVTISVNNKTSDGLRPDSFITMPGVKKVLGSIIVNLPGPIVAPAPA